MTEPLQFRGRTDGQHRAGGNAPVDPAPGWSQGIRALYDAVVQEPLPPDFVKLLDELGKKAGK
jgi:hypothetical protein